MQRAAAQARGTGQPRPRVVWVDGMGGRVNFLLDPFTLDLIRVGVNQTRDGAAYRLLLVR